MTYFGETPTTDGDNTVVRFLESGEFVTPEGVAEGEVLRVGGGAGGAVGGGGAGGVLEGTEALSGTIPITVGEGGTAGADYPGTPAPGRGGHSAIGDMANLIPTMTGYSAPSGVASADSEYSAYPAWWAFDGTTGYFSGNWVSGLHAAPWWVGYQFGEAKTVRTYSVMARNDAAAAPQAWTLQGSTNGSTWDTLDARSGVVNWANSEEKFYPVDTPGDYAYYRLNVTAAATSDHVAIGELRLYSAAFAIGGGVGGVRGFTDVVAGDGGCGGGGYLSDTTHTYGGQGSQGYDGGGNAAYYGSPYPSGGGGGAGGPGGDATSDSTSGVGGVGLESSITGSPVTYAVGGAGMCYGGSGPAGASNTGDGGGGKAAGGCGIVVISYLTPGGGESTEDLFLDGVWG